MFKYKLVNVYDWKCHVAVYKNEMFSISMHFYSISHRFDICSNKKSLEIYKEIFNYIFHTPARVLL